MAGAFPYIGCKISLLSKHGIRYEGTLYTIDPNDSTIALSNVRCFGTEGRRKKDNLPEVEPAPEIFEYIIFKGNDIADLTVCDQPQQPQQPAQPPPQQQQRQMPVAPPAPAPAPTQQNFQMPQPLAQPRGVPQPRPAEHGDAKRTPAPAGAPAPRPRGQNSERLGTGELLVQRRTKKAANVNGVDMSEAYNFEEMNSKLDKTTLKDEFQTDTAAAQKVMPGYKPKASFFDSISCETLDRQQKNSQEANPHRKGHAEMRKLDLETFGETFGRNGFYRGGGGGNRGRGGGGHHSGGGQHNDGGHHGTGGGGGVGTWCWHWRT